MKPNLFLLVLPTCFPYQIKYNIQIMIIKAIMLALSFLDEFSWFNSSWMIFIAPRNKIIISQTQSIHMLPYLYLNITSAFVKAKQVSFSLPVFPAIFCIYLYLLSIERLGLSGVGGLPTLFFYIPHPPTVCHIYLYPYIIIF